MKPLMGQAQSQLNLDDLFSSSQVAGGNFDRARSPKVPVERENGTSKPNFSEVLLRTLDNKPKNQSPITERPASTSSGNQRPERAENANVSLASKAATSERSSVTVTQPKTNKQTFDETKPGKLSIDDSSSPGSGKSTKDLAVDASDKASAFAATTRRDDNADITPTMNAANTSALIPLQKQIDGKLTTDAVVNNNAILSFITGRLDKIEPETLPALVSDSILIKNVMGSGDVAKFMESPVAIGELAKMLELDQNLLSRAAKDGLNPSELVTPKDFIRALGIDPGRVTAELTLLQQNLPSEGVALYIDRAKSMTAMKERGELLSNTPELKTSKLDHESAQKFAKNQFEVAKPTAKSNETNISPETNIAAAMFAQPSATAIGLQNLSNVQSQQNFSENSKPTTPKITINDSLFERPAQFITTTSVIPAAENDSHDVGVFSADNTYSLNTVSSEQPVIEENPVTLAFRSGLNPMTSGLEPFKRSETSTMLSKDEPSDIEMLDVTTDPFTETGLKIDPTTSTKIEFGGNGHDSRSLEEILLDRNVETTIARKRTDTLIAKPEVKSAQDLEELTPLKLEINDGITFDAVAGEKVPDLAINPTESFSNSSFTQGGFSGDQNSSEFLDRGAENIRDITSSMADKAPSTQRSGLSFVSKLGDNPANPTRDSIAQKILGQAEVMFKNGGGSMRMDVEAPGIGKVDVAINLINNQLDVRIITASEQARDIISREVAGLRDGLTQQGLTIRGLEVGKAGDSSSRHFAGQGNHQFGQGAQDQRANYNDMKEYVQSFRNSYSPRTSERPTTVIPSMARWGNLGSTSGSGARLEVRV